MVTKEQVARQLAIAMRALKEIVRIDGMGADMSPPGPAYEVAITALREIGKY